MAGNQNQNVLVATIIFVILTVVSTGVAVMFVQQATEQTKKLKAEQDNTAKLNDGLVTAEKEISDLKKIILPNTNSSGDEEMTWDQVKKQYETDLELYGKQLKTIVADLNKGETATYSQALAAAVKALKERNEQLDLARVETNTVRKEMDGLKATYEAQVKQFRDMAMAVEAEKVEIQKKLTSAEEEVKKVKLENTTIKEEANTRVVGIQADMQKQIDEGSTKLKQTEDNLKRQIGEIEKIKTPEYAAAFDGEITRVNPAARTVWVNVGTYDRLPKNLTFSVQAQGIPAGSELKPKAKIEVIELLAPHLAECRIIEDDLRTPILVGDNIFTRLWDPGQRTRFAFAGKIDIDNDGSDDMDRVRALVARAGGQIDAEVVNGELKGELTIETRFLVLGTVPADKASAAIYNELLEKAKTLGVQRVPKDVFFDQIGYKPEVGQTVQFGGGSSQNLRPTEKPDGGAPVSTGTVSGAFNKRRPPVASGSAY